MSEDQLYVNIENYTDDDDDINNVIRRFPADFESYVVENGLFSCKIPYTGGRVFWSPEGDHPAPCSEIIEMKKSLLRDLCLPVEYLVQFWKATEIEGSSRRTELTTRDQPFYLSSVNSELCSLRLASLGYESYVNGGSEDDLGRLSRVFRQQRLECTPDLCYNSFKDNPQYDGSTIWGSLALPVFEPSGSRCVGVLELVHNNVYFPAFVKDVMICRKLEHFQSFKVASGEELGEELSVEVIDFTKDGKLDFFQIPQALRSPDHRPRTLGNGGVMVWPSSSGQQLMKGNAIHTGDIAVSTTAKSNIAITSSQQNSERQHRSAGIPISLEDVQKQRTKKLNDAAESLGVSRSTLKRACREYGIKWWQPCKRNKDVNQSLPNESVRGVDQPPISDLPREQDKAVEETSNVTIKAKYVDVFIKFQLPVSAGMVEFQQQVAQRVNLEGGTYTVKYKDDEDDWILIGCDEDLHDYISKSRSRGWDTVKMSLQPVITNCPP